MSNSSDDLSSDVSLPRDGGRRAAACQSSSDLDSDDVNLPLVDLLRTELKPFSRAQVMTTTVKMDGLSMDHTNSQLVAHNLRQFTRLRLLSLNWNNIKHGAFFFAELLRHNSSIRSVCMNGNDIQCSGAKHLADTLQCSSCRVRVLEIEDNGIGPAGATALASSLMRNTTVCHLTLRGNPIGDAGASALAAALVANSSLMVLRVDECGMSRCGAIKLFGALGRNPGSCLKLFDVSGNKLHPASVPRAPLLMLPSTTMRELILRCAHIDDSDLVQLSAALLKCPLLHTLSLDGNSLTDCSCTLLRTLLLHCPLSSLNLSANQFGPCTAAVLLRASLDCDRIVRLNFGSNNLCSRHMGRSRPPLPHHAPRVRKRLRFSCKISNVASKPTSIVQRSV